MPRLTFNASRLSLAASRRVVLVLAAACLTSAAGCSDAEGGAEVLRRVRAAERPAPIVAELPRPYLTGDTSATGSVHGIVRLTVVPPEDTIVQPRTNQDVCGTRFVDETVRVVQADRVAGAVVWVSNPPAGKPLPLRRRYELEIERCRITPRVLTAVIGGTVNVKSSDPLLHRVRVMDAASGDTHDVLLHNDRGQVVPVHAPLASAGLLELRGDEHPWMRAWVAVFDHPYFTITGRDGSFTLDGLPPGAYEISTWQERFGIRVDSVVVGEGEVEMEIGIGS